MFGVGKCGRFVGRVLGAYQIFLGNVGGVIIRGMVSGVGGPLGGVFHEFFYKFIMEQGRNNMS